MQVKAFVEGVVAEHGQVDHAVSCFGAWWQGGLLTEQSYEEFAKVRRHQALDAIAAVDRCCNRGVCVRVC